LVQLIEGRQPSAAKASAARPPAHRSKAAKKKSPTAWPTSHNRSTTPKVEKNDFENF